MCECNRFFNPDEFLEKRCTFLYFVIFIHLILGILFAVFSPNGNGYTFLFQHFIQALILFCGIRTLLYTYLAIYIFFSLVNCVSSFIVVGIVLQQLIAVGSNEVSKKLDTAYIVLTAFNFVFLVFSIIFTFPTYKEMKAQLYERVVSGGSDPERRESVDSEELGNQPVSNNQGGGFVAFQGRGRPLGGN